MDRSEITNEAFARIADQFVAEYQQGQQPSIDEYADSHPELAKQIRELFPALVMVEELAPDESLGDAPSKLDVGVKATDRLGDYHIIREVGRGGMGVVYEAEQVSLRRRVALKLLPKHSKPDSSAVERFRLEAQAAARLHHSNIVPVFDVGNQDGLQYYAMQFIQGQGLDSVLRELKTLRAEGEQIETERSIGNTYSVAQRLLSEPNENNGDIGEEKISDETVVGVNDDTGVDALSRKVATLSGEHKSNLHFFQSAAKIGVQVARALEYAHEQGILHRDIKPSNLLLDDRAHVWVTDFGLAKTVGDDLTKSGDIVGTLGYMAPERFRGWSDPRSDVYGLGVTLYELATLRPAFENSDRLKLIHQVCNDEPQRPTQIDRRLPKDLETIILKSIEKEPVRRYATAKAMADDLERFLNGKPIGARRSTHVERTLLMCRRNPVVTSLALALFLVMILAIAGVTMLWLSERNQRNIAQSREEEANTQRLIAQENFRKSVEVVDRYLVNISESKLSGIPGLQPLREELLQDALSYYISFAREYDNDPELQAELANAYYRIGIIEGMKGQDDAAIASHERSLEIRKRLREGSAGHGIHIDLLASLNHLCDLYRRTGSLGRALEMSVEAESIIDRYEARDSSLEFRDRQSDIQVNRGLIFVDQGKLDEAMNCFNNASVLRESIFEDFPAVPDCTGNLISVYNNLGATCLKRGDPAEAIKYLDRATGIQTAVDPMVMDMPNQAESISLVYFNLGTAYESLAELDLSVECLSKSLQLLTPLANQNPGVIEFQVAKADRLSMLAFVFSLRGEKALAFQNASKAEAIWKRLIDTGLADNIVETNYAKSLIQSGFYSRDLGNASAALQYGQNGLQAWMVIVRNHPDVLEYRLAKADATLNCGHFYLAMGSTAQADKMFESAMNEHDAIFAENPDDSQSHMARAICGHFYAEVLRRRGEFSKAMERIQFAVDAMNGVLRNDPGDNSARDHLANAHFAKGLVLYTQNNHEQAIESFHVANNIWKRLSEDNPQRVLFIRRQSEAQFSIGGAHHALSQQSESLDAYTESHDLILSLKQQHPDILKYRMHLIRTLSMLGFLYQRYGHMEEAIDYARQGVEETDELLRISPRNSQYRSQHAQFLSRLGFQLLQQQSLADAEDAFQRAVDDYLALLKANPENTAYRTSLAGNYSNVGTVLQRRELYNEAILQFLRAQDLLEQALLEEATDPTARNYMVVTQTQLAKSYTATEQTDKAKTAVQQALVFARSLADDHPENSKFQSSLADVIQLQSEIEGK